MQLLTASPRRQFCLKPNCKDGSPKTGAAHPVCATSETLCQPISQSVLVHAAGPSDS